MTPRRTAILELAFSEEAGEEPLPLDRDRGYQAVLRSDDGREFGSFKSPFGDHYARKLRDYLEKNASSSASAAGVFPTEAFDFALEKGQELYTAAREATPGLAAFLAGSGPRRLVIASDRPEIHELPWEALHSGDKRLPCEVGVSVVHARHQDFVVAAEAATDPLRIAVLVGARTRQSTRNTLRAPSARFALKMLTPEAGVPIEAGFLDDFRPDVVHVIAHGDPELEQTDLPGWPASPIDLVQRIRARRLVLLWSCYSGTVKAWSHAPAMSLHRTGATLVLSFTVPLRMTTAETLAASFNREVLDARRSTDVESLILAQRERLFRDHPGLFEWLSMTVWLRRPLDLTAAVEDGPRLPADTWGEPAGAAIPSDVVDALRSASVGRVVVTGLDLPSALPRPLVERFRGAVVRIQGRDDLEASTTAILAELQVEPHRLVHGADRLLALLDVLATFKQSLLVWSGTGERETRCFELLGRPPANVAVLLAGASRATASGQQDLGEVERLLDAGAYAQARALLDRLPAPVTEAELLRHRIAGYWCHVRLVDYTRARQTLKEIERLDPFEWLLLDGNLKHRLGNYAEARQCYARALEEAKGRTDRARAQLEMAFVTRRAGDAFLAESILRESIAALETTVEGERNATWRSAIGRAVTDLADLLTADPRREAEAQSALRRALAIHALDERWSQVGGILRTRAILRRRQDSADLAEADLERAVTVYGEQGNLNGWANAVSDLADLAEERGRSTQARVLLEIAIDRVGRADGNLPAAHARLLIRLARLRFRAGELDAARELGGRARQLLGADLRVERQEVDALLACLGALPPPVSAPPAAP